jgi:hypothetical protein
VEPEQPIRTRPRRKGATTAKKIPGGRLIR